MQVINIKKGFELKLAGAPRRVLEERAPGAHVGVAPHAVPGVKPRADVEAGQRVKIGDLLFHDKGNPALRFLAPAGGVVSAVEYGERRVLRQIVIKRDDDEAAVEFPAFDEAALARLGREDLVRHICAGGLWYALRELPFRTAADMDAVPPRILVCLDSLDPCQPDPAVYLAGREDLFVYGLEVLRKLGSGSPELIVAAENTDLAARFAAYGILGFRGRYPAHDPGVLVYHTKKSEAENHAWYIDGQDVLALAHLLRHGRYPIERVYAVGGVPVPTGHVRARTGAQITEITAFAGREHWRVLAGSVFTGYLTEPGAYPGPLDRAFFVINDGERQGKFVDWMLFGPKMTSSFRTFAAWWLPKRKRALNCNMHGGLRSCICCNQCVKLCPVDIMPNLTWKALLAGEIEEALKLGLLDCVECGLCSYGCPSKIELSESLILARSNFKKELT